MSLIKIKTAKFCLDGDTLRIYHLPGAELTLENVKANRETAFKLTGHNKVFALVTTLRYG